MESLSILQIGNMRSLSLVECVDLNFSGSVLQHALCFGDCDNDGLNEFIIGNSEGELGIFRDNKCICKAMDLGTISAVAVGDLLNIHKNVLVIVTVEGWCHVFDVEYELQNQEKSLEDAETDSAPQLLTSDSLISPFHSQRIPPNTKILHLEDVNGDGLVEMIVGLTDRVLRTYQWKLETSDEPLTPNTVNKEDLKEDPSINEIYDGRLFGINKWEFASQIGSIALHRKCDEVSMIVGHPGGSVTHITEIPRSRRRSTVVSGGVEQSMSIGAGSNSATYSSEACSSTTSGHIQGLGKGIESPLPDNITIEYYDLNTNNSMNPHIGSEVIGNVLSLDELDDDCYALASLDGTIVIAKEDNIQWKFQLQTQFLSLRKLDGKILACSGDGAIYVLDRQESTHLHFEESVAAFEVGMYGMGETRKFSKLSSESEVELKSRNCFACVTFHNKVYIYPMDVLQV